MNELKATIGEFFVIILIFAALFGGLFFITINVKEEPETFGRESIHEFYKELNQAPEEQEQIDQDRPANGHNQD